MKANILRLSLMTASLATVFALVGCGDKHEKVHAVGKVEEAQAAALAKAPQAETVKFDDHGQPTVGGVGGVGGTNAPASAAQATSAAATAEALATAHHGQAQTASASESTSAPQAASSSETASAAQAK